MPKKFLGKSLILSLKVFLSARIIKKPYILYEILRCNVKSVIVL